MIAIFSGSMLGLYMTPQKMFRRIRKVDDIRGITFTGVILSYGWDESGQGVVDAYDELRSRQPELFK